MHVVVITTNKKWLSLNHKAKLGINMPQQSIRETVANSRLGPAGGLSFKLESSTTGLGF